MLDVRGCAMAQIPGDLFDGLEELQAVYADNYKLCCPAILPPGFNRVHCRAPFNEISSCDALLRSNAYRVVLAVVAAVALLGNLATFVYRTIVNQKGTKSGFAVFVTNLSFSDFLMGIYLAIIGIADRAYLNTYLWEDTAWRHSTACQAAGFLSFLSSEVSAFLVCLITLDRFVVLRFPFTSLRFGKRSSVVACALLWVVGAIIAAFPFVGSSATERPWHFYSQTGICIPLPVTRDDFQGHDYAFGVMIVLNFVLFVLIASGQAFIFLSIRANSVAAADTTRQSQDMRIARGLITIAVSDFLCWFPSACWGCWRSRECPSPVRSTWPWPSSCCRSTRRSILFCTI